MRRIALLALLLVTAPLLAYQDSGFTIFTPTRLMSGEGEFNVNHRFYGPVDEDVWDTLFGMNAGANVGFGFRRNIMHGIEAKAAYTRSKKRVDLGASWRPTSVISPVAAQMDLAWFSFEQAGIEKRRNNFLLLGSAQNRIWSEHGVLTLNAGYDAYYERFIAGGALHGKLSEGITLIGEYYPVLDRDSAPAELQSHLGEHDAFVLGVKFDTYGHHFMFSVSNSHQNQPATLSLGTDSEDLHLGFNIQRRF